MARKAGSGRMEKSKGTPLRDSSGSGVRANRGRGGCTPPADRGRSKSSRPRRNPPGSFFSHARPYVHVINKLFTAPMIYAMCGVGFYTSYIYNGWNHHFSLLIALYATALVTKTFDSEPWANQ